VTVRETEFDDATFGRVSAPARTHRKVRSARGFVAVGQRDHRTSSGASMSDVAAEHRHRWSPVLRAIGDSVARRKLDRSWDGGAVGTVSQTPQQVCYSYFSRCVDLREPRPTLEALDFIDNELWCAQTAAHLALSEISLEATAAASGHSCASTRMVAEARPREPLGGCFRVASGDSPAHGRMSVDCRNRGPHIKSSSPAPTTAVPRRPGSAPGGPQDPIAYAMDYRGREHRFRDLTRLPWPCTATAVM
jgi:hypothetical protein